jgi:hypothetical protein
MANECSINPEDPDTMLAGSGPGMVLVGLTASKADPELRKVV